MKQFRIGRNQDNEIVLNYPQISSYHADIIISDNGLITLTDHSTNGTYINGQSIHNQSVNVKRGDNINFAYQANLDWNRIFSGGTQMIGNNFQGTAPIGGAVFSPQPAANYAPPIQNDYYQYQPEEGMGLMIAGGIFALLGGLLGCVFGAILCFSKVTNNGKTEYKYAKNARTIGAIEMVISIVFFIVYVSMLS